MVGSVSTTFGGVPRVCRGPATALHRAVWWDPHFDRSARRPPGEVGQQLAHRVAKGRSLGLPAGVERLQDSRDGG